MIERVVVEVLRTLVPKTGGSWGRGSPSPSPTPTATIGVHEHAADANDGCYADVAAEVGA